MSIYKIQKQFETARATIRVNNKAAIYSNAKGKTANQMTKKQKGKR